MSGLVQQSTVNDAVQQWNVGDCVTDLSWSPDSGKVAVSDAAGMISVFDVQAGVMIWSVIAHVSGVLQVEWRADGGVIASAGQDGLIKLWDPASGELQSSRTVSDIWVDHIAWSPDADKLAAASGKTLIVWDQQGSEILRSEDHPSTITAIKWKFNSREIATACYKGVRLFRMQGAKPYKTLHCLGSLIALEWSPDGECICAGSQDRMLQFWRLSANKGGHAEMKGYPEKVSNISWNSKGNYLATAGGNTVVVWSNKGKGPTGTAPKVLKGHRQRITQLSYQHKGAYLASAAQDGDILIWQLKNGLEPVCKWPGDAEITRLLWSPDDQILIAGNKQGQVQQYAVVPA